MSRTVIDLRVGELGYIKSCQNQHYACKLLALGLLPKATVRVVRKAPFGGALYIKIGNHQVALRKEEAVALIIE